MRREKGRKKKKIYFWFVGLVFSRSVFVCCWWSFVCLFSLSLSPSLFLSVYFRSACVCCVLWWYYSVDDICGPRSFWFKFFMLSFFLLCSIVFGHWSSTLSFVFFHLFCFIIIDNWPMISIVLVVDFHLLIW